MLKDSKEEQTWRAERAAQHCLSAGGHIADEWKGCLVARWCHRTLWREAPSTGFRAGMEESTPEETMHPVLASRLSPLPRHPDRS